MIFLSPIQRPFPSQLLLLLFLLLLISCERPDPETAVFVTPGPTNALPPTPALTPFSGSGPLPPTPELSPADAVARPTYFGTPTPDPPHGTAVTCAS